MRSGGLPRYLGEALLALVLCVGLFIVSGMLAPISTNLTGGAAELLSRRIVFDRDGKPCIEYRETTYSHRRRSRVVTWYDIDGNQIGTYPEHKAPRLRLGGILDFNEVLKGSWRGGRRADLTDWRFLPPPGMEVPIWHRLPYRGLLAGHVYPYGRQIGYLGPKGFIEPDKTGPGFVDPRYIATVPLLGPIWVDRDRIYSIDLEKLKVRELWRSPSGPIRALGYVHRMAVVLCGNTLRVIDPSLEVRLEAELPLDLRRNVAWQVAWMKDRLVISNLAQMHAIVYHLSPTGEVLERWEVDVPLSRGMSRTRKVALTVAASIMSPWVGVALDEFLGYTFPNVHRLIRDWLDWPYRLPFLTVSLIFTFISTALIWRHLRLRCTRFQMGLGLAITVVFSWPGYLVGLSLFELASRIACPSCRRPRATDRQVCPYCGADWPGPSMTGSEILLPAAEEGGATQQ